MNIDIPNIDVYTAIDRAPGDDRHQLLEWLVMDAEVTDLHVIAKALVQEIASNSTHPAYQGVLQDMMERLYQSRDPDQAGGKAIRDTLDKARKDDHDFWSEEAP